MPKSCCVPGCKANYKQGEYVPVFVFPSDEERVRLWKKAIPRKDLIVNRNTVVCINHFPEDQILREIRVSRPDGTELVVPRKRLELKPGAVPSIFPNLPKYLSSDASVLRTDPEDRRRKRTEYENQKRSEWLLKDTISCVEDILANRAKFVPQNPDWILEKHCEQVYFLKIEFNECPTLKKTLVIDTDLSVRVISDGININVQKFASILGSELVCNSYSKLGNLLTAINDMQQNDVSLDNIKHIQNILKKCIENCGESKLKVGLNFVSEQLNLLTSNQLRYSPDTLVFACSFFLSFPAAYKFLRSSQIIVLPHPSYLKTFNLSSINCDVNQSLVKYLKMKCDTLEAHEKLVCLLLDEIYVKPRITYKANKVVGMAKNLDDLTPATTIQTFMITSVLSKNKDVVALAPVKNPNADFLQKSTLSVLNVLHQTGYEVIAVVADNANINVKCFKLLCQDNAIHPYIAHPSDSEKKCFLLFDTVHLLKNIRNNWLNEKSSTFIYPSINDSNAIKVSKFQDVRSVYEAQKQNIVKHAPGLSYRVCFPNSLERQNVSFVVPLFEDKTIAAMSTVQDSDGTKEWLQIIRNWWMTVNVKHPKKGINLRDKFSEPIKSMEQENIQYLRYFCSWLKCWDDIIIMDRPERCGKLSRQTFSALLHTTETLIKLCEYLLNDLKLCYVMLGVFQTDDLERRFGKYRQMSGCNYNISVQQVIESERKIKVTSLLKLKSRQSLSVAQMLNDINTASENGTGDDCPLPEQLEDVLNVSEQTIVESSTLEIIIFLAGYVGFKVSLNQQCVLCKNCLLTDSELICELPPEVKYLNFLNRGGLKYPSNMSIELGIEVYKVFCVLVSDKFKMVFLNSDNPKCVAKTLALESMQLADSTVVCDCGKNLEDLAGQCVDIWVNIFLNNFSKIHTDLCIQESASKRVGLLRREETGLTSCKRSRKAAVFMEWKQ